MLRSASVSKDSQRLLQVVMNFPQLAESNARGEEAQRRERRHAALIEAIVCPILQKMGLESIHLCDNRHGASPT